MISIRKFNHSDADYEAVLAVYNADWPENPQTVEIWRHRAENHNKKYLDQRFVIEIEAAPREENRIVASCVVWESSWSYVPGKYGMAFDIHPDFVNQGIEGQMFNHMVTFLNQRTPAPTIFDTSMREDRTERVQFWADHGFEVIMRENESALDVTDYDFPRFDTAFERVTANGIEIATLADLQQRFPDWLQRYYDLLMPIYNDIPSPDTITPETLEEFAKGFTQPKFLADAEFIALDSDQWVGLSALSKDLVNIKRLWVGITGVLPTHRRRGIATALKLKTIQYAIDYGAETIQTGNEENNPMYDLNVMLGFKPLPAWLEMRKKVNI
ncbi:MAG: GNAT family N-acetyltransferase [Chloroflexota bacterium]